LAFSLFGFLLICYFAILLFCYFAILLFCYLAILLFGFPLLALLFDSGIWFLLWLNFAASFIAFFIPTITLWQHCKGYKWEKF